MLETIASWSGWISGLALFISFILTFCPARLRPFSVASYVVGVLAGFTIILTIYFLLAKARSEAGLPRVTVILSWLAPAGALFFVLAAASLLVPAIPQRKALLLGKVLHLCFLPILAVFLEFIISGQGRHPFNTAFLLYGVLWFRIREGYAGLGPSSVS